MGHILFILLHLVCLVWFTKGLVVTIPLHIIYAAISGSQKKSSAFYLKKCPDCSESIKAEARKCKHCGREFTENEVLVAWKAALAPCCEKGKTIANNRCAICGRYLAPPALV